MTLQWAALGVSALGAALGGLVGAVGASAQNRPYAGPALVGAALGAILASAVAPRPPAASAASVASASP